MNGTPFISGNTSDPCAKEGLRIETFVYPCETDATSPWHDLLCEQKPQEAPCVEAAEDVRARLEEQIERAFTAGREQGIAEGRKLERAEHATADVQRTASLERALHAFTAARTQTVQEFEPAVARLALAIASRILRREAHTDPLLLSGAVRVALGQLASSSQVRLRVPAAEQELWAEWAAMLSSGKTGLVVEAAEGMRLGDCVVETDLGSADLGVAAQLGEIDRTFFEARTEAASA